MNNRVRWRLGALAGAVALLGSLASLEAHALGLGRISVQSALGEPLRAEVDIAEISAEEAASLRAGVAPPDAFRAAGLEYSSAIIDLQVSLQKRSNGRPFLRLSSTRPVTEPFVDLILEANWASGRIVRDYTMLFDPPNLRPSGSAGSTMAPTAPLLSRPAAPSMPPAPSAVGIGSIPYSPPAPAAAPPVRPVPVAKAAPQKPDPVARAASGGQQVTVKPGETAGKIAAQYKPASVSLDQMLVALLRSNPDSFISGNINRLKSGAVLEIPDAEQAAAATSAEASRTIVAQAKDFNDFRRKFAQNVPTAQVGTANRQATGQVQAKVEDKAPATTTPDKLTLSKGAVQGKVAAEEKIAKERQAREASARVAELSKNIGDLNKLAGAPGAATAASAAKGPGVAVTTPAVVLPAPVPVAAPAAAAASVAKAVTATAPAATAVLVPVPAPALVSSIPATVSPTVTMTATATTASTSATVAPVASAASTPVAVASAPGAAASQAAAPALEASAAAPVAVKKPAVVLPPPPQPSLFDELTENPFVLPGFAALLLLLGGFGFYRYRQRNNATQVDSSFLESRLQPDSFFGASGGQRIDTSEGGATGSSLVYSPSQLDAAGDVDPVAEADVYLAYGRDLQAEEILKEAIRTTPTRVAIHAKLMEIYAKRRDIKAFEVIAMEAYNLTRGEGPEWAYIGEMGRELDPSNPMYQPGGQPSGPASKESHAGPDSGPGFGSSTIPQIIHPQDQEASDSVDFDLDLDFSLGDEPVAVTPPPTPPAPAPV
ncbi:MAG: FimV/HubP family polar landmark protein, partial [Pseudomonadota bacterium]